MNLSTVLLQYSNAVLVAILPHVSDFAKKLELPVPPTITTNHVRHFGGFEKSERISGHLVLTNGYEFWFNQGHVDSFSSPRSYLIQQDPKLVSKFYGPLRLTKTEAIEFARSAVRKLGYSEDLLYLDPTPKVKGPEMVGQNIIPYYNIEWLNPRFGNASVVVEVDGATKSIRSMWLIDSSLWKADPPINVPKPSRTWTSLKDPPANAETAAKFLIRILPDIEKLSRELELPLTYPVTTNQVVEFICEDRKLGLYGKVIFKSGHYFLHEYGHLLGFTAPDAFFVHDRAIRVNDFIGEPKLSEESAITLARETVRKLGYSEENLHVERTPEITKPTTTGHVRIPRLVVRWTNAKGGILLSSVIMEVDTANQSIKSLRVFNPNFSRRAMEGSAPKSGKNQPDGDTKTVPSGIKMPDRTQPENTSAKP
jgi:hypothetical protein